MSNYSIESMNKAIKEVFDYFGFGGFNVALYESCDEYGKVFITLKKSFDRKVYIQDISETISDIADDLKNSQYYTNLKSIHLGEIDSLKKDIRRLEKQVESLRKYETYYKLHYKMNHGDCDCDDDDEYGSISFG